MTTCVSNCERQSRMDGRNKSEVPECVLPYYDSRDELTIQGNLIFEGQLLVVPAALRTELMSVVHASHIGIEGCPRRMRECLYWPRMTTQVKDYISKCEVCLLHRSAPPREPLRQHDFVSRPWSKIGADLCQIDGPYATRYMRLLQQFY